MITNKLKLNQLYMVIKEISSALKSLTLVYKVGRATLLYFFHTTVLYDNFIISWVGLESDYLDSSSYTGYLRGGIGDSGLIFIFFTFLPVLTKPTVIQLHAVIMLMYVMF